VILLSKIVFTWNKYPGARLQEISMPEEVLENREQRLRSQIIRECLVKWRGLPVEDVTWEGAQILEHPSLMLLEDKVVGSRDGSKSESVDFQKFLGAGAFRESFLYNT
jgi:hypothetical protein